ncbi:hypothetical protein GJ744_009185 [Endocarpon pusillum]|uniref:tRNA(Phe) 7-[(3-amino-3-carboxypropyl)-4-demethylwyosine(37)-N(4)]-methyltransferase n=1 Tax=Endocarpon pusillum TaxID=364733 RepID=A0A8H7AIE2_9EURO|nr:hypothetical protein GJ744_009185 [Endocarpon pusillum]
MPPPIPHTFNRKKATILEGLSVPDSEYSDKSPKGSVDERVRELIDEINAYDGFVTTSSCAGRIAVFQEGNGQGSNSRNEEDALGSSGVPGGKGGGKFLFVSHEPVSVAEDVASQQLPRILGLDEEPGACGAKEFESWAPGQRFVRFAFEPMILHVMTASLHHAKPLLSAAINSGFRESGVQSLKNLDNPNACPMVAIRTAGLGLEAIIALFERDHEVRVSKVAAQREVEES